MPHSVGCFFEFERAGIRKIDVTNGKLFRCTYVNNVTVAISTVRAAPKIQAIHSPATAEVYRAMLTP